MGIVDDILKALDRIPTWKRLHEVPSELDQLRAKVAAMRLLVAGDRIGQESRHQTSAFPAIIDLGSWRQSSFVP